MVQITDTNTESTEQIRKRLFFLLAIALLALVLGLTITISLTLFGSLKNAEAKSLVRIAEIRSMAISEWCRRAKDIAKQITSRTRIRQELEKYNKSKITLQHLDRFTRPKLQDAMNLSSEVTGILRLDAKNQVVTTCGSASSLPLNGQNLEQYITHQPAISEPVIIDKRLSLVVSAPIINRKGEKQGTDLVSFDVELLRKIVANFDELGRTSEIIVGYASGQSIRPLLTLEGNVVINQRNQILCTWSETIWQKRSTEKRDSFIQPIWLWHISLSKNLTGA